MVGQELPHSPSLHFLTPQPQFRLPLPQSQPRLHPLKSSSEGGAVQNCNMFISIKYLFFIYFILFQGGGGSMDVQYIIIQGVLLLSHPSYSQHESSPLHLTTHSLVWSAYSFLQTCEGADALNPLVTAMLFGLGHAKIYILSSNCMPQPAVSAYDLMHNCSLAADCNVYCCIKSFAIANRLCTIKST